MNVAQLQLALGRLTSPAATEKPDLAGYEAQGGLPGWAGGSCAPRARSLAGAQGLGGQGCGRRAALAWGTGFCRGCGAGSWALPQTAAQEEKGPPQEVGEVMGCPGCRGHRLRAFSQGRLGTREIRRVGTAWARG